MKWGLEFSIVVEHYCIEQYDYIGTFTFNVTITRVVFTESEGEDICTQKQSFQRGLDKLYIE